MPFSAGGVFTRLYNWVADRDAGINITATRMDAETDGIVTGLNQIVDGTQPIKAPVRGAYGTAAAPGHSFDGDTDTGIYRPAADQLAGTEGGVDLGRLYGRKNIVGTVAQAGGIPTGAIIQTGSNANGDFIRLADGTQVCTHVLSASGSLNTTWTYPATFSAPVDAALATGITAAGNARTVTMAGSGSTTSITVQMRDPNDAAANASSAAFVFAIGRWF